MSDLTSDQYCTRCGELLAPDKIVTLELSFKTGLYQHVGKIPADESQGCFPFGSACAKAVLKNGGRNQKIRLAKRGSI